MKIVIDTVDHKDMINYPSVGDWRYDEDGILHIKVAKLSNEKYECLVALHEFIEALSCRYNNITQQEVDIFDENYEMNRPDGNVDEPGDDPGRAVDDRNPAARPRDPDARRRASRAGRWHDRPTGRWPGIPRGECLVQPASRAGQSRT